jgi:hypothetical protein
VGILRKLVLEAQENGELLPAASVDDVVDLIMGVYLLSQFQWTNISGYTREFCIEKVNRCFDMALASSIHRENKTE